ncbi:citramalyl-CoA lyase, mitochondrial isoform X3 [Struthio camelus]|uniref:citramalyl-CoA lyase, mitochondrial isoform X3 n=1 Tax=Struthio camelus TaxID=8801 RepID=UPI003603E73A
MMMAAAAAAAAALALWRAGPGLGRRRLVNSPLPAGVPKLSYHFASSHKYVPRRAVLYVPADDEKKIRKIPSLNVDCAVLDCEDGVALNRKREARLTVVKTLEEFDFGHAEKCVRINSVSSGLAEQDLEVLLQSRTLPSSMMLPKVENVEEIRWFADKFSHHLQGRTLVEPMNFIPFVETARGLLSFKAVFDKRLVSYCYINSQSTNHSNTQGTMINFCSKAVCEEALRAGSQVGFHLDAVVFGGEDFRASIGATSSKETHDILYARQKIIVTAKAFGLQAIDLVYIDFRDEDGLRKQSREGASMGFTGKQVIHPNQIAVVQEQFSPSPEKIKWAQELISAFEEHQRLGKGAFTFHGSMIDMPLLKQAQNIVTLATAIKKK